jgi:hypothetical protein
MAPIRLIPTPLDLDRVVPGVVGVDLLIADPRSHVVPTAGPYSRSGSYITMDTR